MDTSNPLLAGVVIAAGIQGVTQVINLLLANPTAKKANQINTDRLALEREKAVLDRERQDSEERAKEKTELRTDRDSWKSEAQRLQKENDAWRNRCIEHGSFCQIEIRAPPVPVVPPTVNRP